MKIKYLLYYLVVLLSKGLLELELNLKKKES